MIRESGPSTSSKDQTSLWNVFSWRDISHANKVDFLFLFLTTGTLAISWGDTWVR